MLSTTSKLIVPLALLLCLGCEGPESATESSIDVSQFTRPDNPEFVAEVYESDLPVLVDFYATWCGPCRELAPLVHHLETEYAGRLKVVTIDVDQQDDLSDHYQVKYLPTLALFDKGELVAMESGAPSEDQLRQWIEANVDLTGTAAETAPADSGD